MPYAPAVPYTALLLDLDHTLLDSDASEAHAFDHALASAGVADPERYLPAYQEINLGLWRQVERGELAPEHLRVVRFARLVETTGFAASPAALADAFAYGLGAFGELYPGARELLDALAAAPGISLALVTNGISDIVRTRLARLDLGRYFRTIAISSELGTAKPAPAIFEAALAGLGSPPRPSALMVGDNLASDIQGGRNAGIATCWYNPHGRTGGAGLADHEIATHDALLAVIGA
ncbi:MAG TPA: YjjG family noncanonical pyrimidine nucleotidase [Kofleriaceae bacterium]|nr:YjjG family noncanonical pyrimidine nucleotidase [Kofleriaceae bacterium]